MRIRVVRIIAVLWAGFWLWFGVGWAIHEHLPWHGLALSAFRPGLMFGAVVAIAWFWPRPGGALLVVTGFLLACWYGIYFGHMPTATKLFVLSTIAVPPVGCGLALLWPGTAGAGTTGHEARV